MLRLLFSGWEYCETTLAAEVSRFGVMEVVVGTKCEWNTSSNCTASSIRREVCSRFGIEIAFAKIA
jgi:hypothetical protein